MKKYLRLLQIYRVVAAYRLFELLEGLDYARSARLLLRLPAPFFSRRGGSSRGQRLRLALEELGPIFIKFGQLLSTRRDLVPTDIADELAKLQDQVAPFPGAQAQALIEATLGSPVSELFSEFSTEPLASASIAQVHGARLKSGEEVVIKVIRPGIEATITQDIALLHTLAALMEKYLRQGRRLRPREIVRDYEHVIFDELNLLAEGANTSQLRRNFENSPALYVPRVYWDFCQRNVLVMERIHGIPVSDVAALEAAGINLKKLAETGVAIFFTQVFNHSFFHADMHPGNIFVSREHPDRPQYIAIDCAIIGSLSKADQQYLAHNLLAIFKRDYRRVAELHVESGWVPADTPVNAFEATMRSVCEPIFQKPLKDISFGLLLIQLFQTASRFNMEVQPSLILLQKTLLNVEGLGKQLYPDLDLWQTALPFLEEWQKQRLSPLENLKKIREKLPQWLEQLPEIPELLLAAISATRDGRHQLQAQLAQQEKTRLQEKARLARRKLRFALVALAGALVMSQPALAIRLESLPPASLFLLIAGLTLLYFRE
ncbi:MAG: ubiquinone biosynthesis regulatory protein kinase UbiB [Pseudomonadales bacterium]|nr:ubiquinone biosynthesis regulatory protein kinase UbiB [Pseudomonadales bacterium]